MPALSPLQFSAIIRVSGRVIRIDVMHKTSEHQQAVDESVLGLIFISPATGIVSFIRQEYSWISVMLFMLTTQNHVIKLYFKRISADVCMQSLYFYAIMLLDMKVKCRPTHQTSIVR